MADDAPNFDVIDNPAIAESYANKLVAASFDGGAVVITLGVTRFVPTAGADAPKDVLVQIQKKNAAAAAKES